jgi:hypothetical protein
MTNRRAFSAAFLSLLVAAGCGTGAVASPTAASPDGAAPPESGDGAPAGDGPSAQDATSPPDATPALDSSAEATQGDSPSGEASASAGCIATSTSSLQGVSLVLRSPITCTFTLAEAQAGISVPYDVVVTSDVAGVVPAPQDAGGCGAPGSSGLIVFEQLVGSGQSYCVCDTGLCAPGSPPAVTLRAGSYGSGFSWTGHNWSGPSDTGNPLGAAFPPGSYTLTLSAKGTQGGTAFAVTTTLTIVLTP